MEYIRHTDALDCLYGNLDKLLQKNSIKSKQIIMFGSSKVAGMILYYLSKHGLEVESIIDNNKNTQGQIVYGKHVYSPEERLAPFSDEVLVLIASGFQKEMIIQLESMGYQQDKHILKIVDLPALMEDYSFVDRNNYTELTNQEIRQSQLRCLKKVKELCEKHNLRYFLCGGTLLGAVRHQGYIPWDDDIDIFIVLKDWIKFAELMKQEEAFGFISFLGEDDYYDDMGILYDKTNICDSNHFPMQITAGVSIDIMPLIGLPKTEEDINKYARRLKEQSAKVHNTLYSKEECKQECQKLYEMMLEHDYDESENVGHILGPYFMKEIRPKEWFAETVNLTFEDDSYAAPVGYDKYLTKLYGDYMTLPPEDKRINHHFFRAYHKQKENYYE